MVCLDLHVCFVVLFGSHGGPLFQRFGSTYRSINIRPAFSPVASRFLSQGMEVAHLAAIYGPAFIVGFIWIVGFRRWLFHNWIVWFLGVH